MNCAYCGSEIIEAQLERVKKSRSTRIKIGLENRKKKGFRLGRPQFINPQAVILMRRHGKSIRKIARDLCCSPAAVHKILKAVK